MRGRTALWAAVGLLALSGAALSGCDVPVVSGDDEETIVTTPTTGPETTGPTGPSGGNGGGGGDKTPADTGPTVPESGGVGADGYDPEQDIEGNDLPPPPGSPQEQFEQACEANPDACD